MFEERSILSGERISRLLFKPMAKYVLGLYDFSNEIIVRDYFFITLSSIRSSRFKKPM